PEDLILQCRIEKYVEAVELTLRDRARRAVVHEPAEATCFGIRPVRLVHEAPVLPEPGHVGRHLPAWTQCRPLAALKCAVCPAQSNGTLGERHEVAVHRFPVDPADVVVLTVRVVVAPLR